MNFHSPQPWQRWQSVETATVIAMRADGKTNRAIAKVLGRTRQAVAHQARALQILSRPKPTPTMPMPPRELMTIPKAMLTDWYALGWRVQNHDATHCYLIWPHRGEPRIPEC